jgi:hypothetical protein
MGEPGEMKSKRTFTPEELTASDGRVWTPEECELVAEWYTTSDVHDLNKMADALDDILPNWDVIPDPPAVFILRGISPNPFPPTRPL